MSDAAPPPWVKSAPGLSAAHKFMLGVLWGYGPYAREELWVTIDGDRQPRAPARCWESCEDLARLTGEKQSTVRSQLRKLRDAGWFERGAGSMRTLAWRAPGVFAYGAGVTDVPKGVTSGPGELSPPTGDSYTPRGEPLPPKGSIGVPQTFHEPSNDVEVGARDPHPDDVWLMRDKSLDPAPTPPKVNALDDWRKNRARIQLETERARAAARDDDFAQAHGGALTGAMPSGAMPSGTKLPLDVFRAIEAHDNGAWSVSVASLTWADACADTMDGDNLDLPHVLRLLDAWTAEARPTRQPSQPRKRVLWYTYGDQGRRARAWVERAMASTRAALRVVNDVDVYELELEEMRR